MSVLMIMEWPGVSREQYEVVRNDLDWMTNQPEGGLLHVAGFTDDGMRVVDLWESAQHFQPFQESRLAGSVAKAGIVGAPNVQIVDAAYIDLLGIKQMV